MELLSKVDADSVLLAEFLDVLPILPYQQTEVGRRESQGPLIFLQTRLHWR